MTSPAPLVYITGASSGIGQALAARYAAAGWRLALVARRQAEMQAWAREHGLGPDRLAVYVADVRDLDAITGAAAACIAAQGLPDVVIANAGVSIGIDPGDARDLAVTRETLEINLLGLAATLQPFVDPMLQRGRGALVGVASVAAIRGLPGHGAYCASKAGVVAYCESLRADCRPRGVHVVTLVPGYVATPLTSGNRYAMPFLISAEQFAERAFRAIQAGRRWRVIPWPMGLVVALMRVLPDAWFDRAVQGRGRKQRRVG